MIRLFDGITATATAELSTRRCKDVVLVHEITAPTNGGYCSFIDRTYSLDSTNPISIVSASRATNVVTITTTAAHGLTVGQTVVIAGVTAGGATSFDGTFTIVAVDTTTTFTYASTAANDSGAGGTAKRVVQVAHLSTASGGGTNIKTADTATSYQSIITNCADFLLVTCNVTDGVHTVFAKSMPDGLVQ